MTPYEQEAHDKDPFYVSPEEIEAAIEDVTYYTTPSRAICHVRCKNGLTIIKANSHANLDIGWTIALGEARTDIECGLRYEKASNLQRFAEAERTIGVLMAMGEQGGE
jgi:hypothetical protein